MNGFKLLSVLHVNGVVTNDLKYELSYQGLNELCNLGLASNSSINGPSFMGPGNKVYNGKVAKGNG